MNLFITNKERFLIKSFINMMKQEHNPINPEVGNKIDEKILSDFFGKSGKVTIRLDGILIEFSDRFLPSMMNKLNLIYSVCPSLMKDISEVKGHDDAINFRDTCLGYNPVPIILTGVLHEWKDVKRLNIQDARFAFAVCNEDNIESFIVYSDYDITVLSHNMENVKCIPHSFGFIYSESDKNYIFIKLLQLVFKHVDIGEIFFYERSVQGEINID